MNIFIIDETYRSLRGKGGSTRDKSEAEGELHGSIFDSRVRWVIAKKNERRR